MPFFDSVVDIIIVPSKLLLQYQSFLLTSKKLQLLYYVFRHSKRITSVSFLLDYYNADLFFSAKKWNAFFFLLNRTHMQIHVDKRNSQMGFFKLILEREEEGENHQFVVLPFYAFIGCFLYVPWLAVNLQLWCIGTAF